MFVVFVVEFGSLCIFAIVSTGVLKAIFKEWEIGKLISQKIFSFVLYSFTFRFFFEQFFKILITICIEILYISNSIKDEID